MKPTTITETEIAGIIDELSAINIDLGQQETTLYSDAVTIYSDTSYSYYSGDIYGDIHSENYDPIHAALFWASPDISGEF